MPQRRRPLTFRARLTATYALLLTVAGAAMLGVVYYVVGVAAQFDVTAAEPPGTSSHTTSHTTATEAPATPGGQEQAPDAADGSVPASTSTPSLSVTSRSDLQRLILWVAALLLVALAGVGAFAGWVIAGRMVRPLREVAGAAGRAATGRLDHRIGLGAPRDEITQLAATFDGMLDSLESSFRAHRRFAANASHELRTPLSTTRTMLDVALPGASGPQRELLEGLRAMNERSIATVTALLDLAEIEAAPGGARERIDLSPVVRSVLDDSGASPATFEVEPGAAEVEGDPRLVRVLVENLVRNALQHGAPGGPVTVSVGGTGGPGGEVRLRIENAGRALAADDVERLREPFVRARERSGAGPERGRGLGLAIVHAVAERHGAVLGLAPRPGGGLVVEVSFPRPPG